MMAGLVALESAVVSLPAVLAEAMLAGLQEPGVTIGAGAYETELAMCPVAAAVRFAEKSGDPDRDWDPAWGTQAEFPRRVLDFVDAFDSSAELVGLDATLSELTSALERAFHARQALLLASNCDDQGGDEVSGHEARARP